MRQAQVLSDLRAIREQETREHDDKFGYTGTLARIADMLQSQHLELCWILGDELDTEPPLSTTEFIQLVSLLRNARVSDWLAAGCVSVSVDALPTVAEFDLAVRSEREAHGAWQQDVSTRQEPEYTDLQDMLLEVRLELMQGTGPDFPPSRENQSPTFVLGEGGGKADTR